MEPPDNQTAMPLLVHGGQCPPYGVAKNSERFPALDRVKCGCRFVRRLFFENLAPLL